VAASPSVVVIVLNWCGEQDTLACIESLEQSTYPAFRILLVDNASPDGSGERLHSRFPKHAYLQTGSNLGYAGGNNRAFDRAIADGADYCVVLNNDTVVDRQCIERLVNTALEHNAALVAPKILYHDAPDVVWFAGGDFSPKRALGLHIVSAKRVPSRSRSPQGAAF
jgi:GT2 family glycosyltransferase